MNDAVLICPGPSFNPDSLTTLHEIGDVYTVNRAIRAYQDSSLRPMGCFFMDGIHHFEEERPLIEDPGFQKFVRADCAEGWGVFPNTICIEVIRNRSRSINPFETPGIKGPILTTTIAWQALVRSDYKRIRIVGCDCGVEGDSPYFFNWKEYSGKITRKRKRYEEVYLYLKAWHKHARTETINLSAKSALADFLPTLTTGELLNEQR